MILRAVPQGCRRALDAGCGHGGLVQELASHCEAVTGLDVDAGVIRSASELAGSRSAVEFVRGDVMTHPFAEGSFDVITAVASLHHLPLAPALERFRALLRPGGVLAVVGLYRPETLLDYG